MCVSELETELNSSHCGLMGVGVCVSCCLLKTYKNVSHDNEGQ